MWAKGRIIYFAKSLSVNPLSLLNQQFPNVGLQATAGLRYRFTNTTQNNKNMDKAVSFLNTKMFHLKVYPFFRNQKLLLLNILL